MFNAPNKSGLYFTLDYGILLHILKDSKEIHDVLNYIDCALGSLRTTDQFRVT